MSRVRIGLLFLLILLALGLVSQSIVKISLVQLRVLLAREQLLNYELSSRMLRAKFKQMLLQKDDLTTEVKMKVLESSVMNIDRTEQVKLSPDEILGLWVVNAVRLLNLKPFLSLEEDQNRLLLLQYAFHLERTRKYPQAAEKYAALEDEFSSGDENLAFVLLHNGFCLALAGQTETAIQKLEKVEAEYRGTHYQENATILIGILREGQQRQDDILKKFESEVERARALYQNGQYAAALASFEKAQELTFNDRYQKARSMEEVGETRRAINEYMSLANQNASNQVAKEANRRLLVIGEVYDGGEKVKKYAEEKAIKLGDTEVLREVKEVSALKKEPEVVAQIQKKLKENPESVDAETLEQLQSIKEDLENTLNAEEKQVAAIVSRQETEDDAEAQRLARRKQAADYLLAARAGKAPLRLRVELADGRRIRGLTVKRLEVGGQSFIEIRERFSVRIPLGELEEIALDAPGEKALVMVTGAGAPQTGDRIVRRTHSTGEGPNLKETHKLTLLQGAKSRGLEGEILIAPIVPAAPGLFLLVEWKGQAISYGTDLAVRGDLVVVYSGKHQIEVEREALQRVELVQGLGRNFDLEIRFQNGQPLAGTGIKRGWRGFQLYPGGNGFPLETVRDLIPVPK